MERGLTHAVVATKRHCVPASGRTDDPLSRRCSSPMGSTPIAGPSEDVPQLCRLPETDTDDHSVGRSNPRTWRPKQDRTSPTSIVAGAPSSAVGLKVKRSSVRHRAIRSDQFSLSPCAIRRCLGNEHLAPRSTFDPFRRSCQGVGPEIANGRFIWRATPSSLPAFGAFRRRQPW